MNKKDKKALKELDRYLKQRQDLVLSRKVLHTAILQRIDRLIQIAQKFEADRSPSISPLGSELYAWQVEDIARELRFLMFEL